MEQTPTASNDYFDTDLPKYLKRLDATGTRVSLESSKPASKKKAFAAAAFALLASFAAYNQIESSHQDNTAFDQQINTQQNQSSNPPGYTEKDTQKLARLITTLANKQTPTNQEKVRKPEKETQPPYSLAKEQIQALSYLEFLKNTRFLQPLNARKIYAHATEPVRGKPKIKWLNDFLEDAFLQGKLSFFNTPERFAYLKDIVFGIVTQESKFDDSVVSSANGRGAFQITPINWIDNVHTKGKKMPWHISMNLDYKQAAHSFEHAALVALNHLDKRIPKAVYKNAMKAAFDANLPPKEAEKFAIYAMVNAYNTGQTLISKLLSKFSKHIKQNRIKKDFGFDLFTEFAEFAKKHSPLYKKDAESYTPLTMAAVEALKELGLYQPASDYSSPYTSRQSTPPSWLANQTQETSKG